VELAPQEVAYMRIGLEVQVVDAVTPLNVPGGHIKQPDLPVSFW